MLCFVLVLPSPNTRRKISADADTCRLVTFPPPPTPSSPPLPSPFLPIGKPDDNQMEGLEGMKAEDVSGVGQAAEIIEWMRRECPDMVAVAPLLKELRFTGFSDSRSVQRRFVRPNTKRAL